MPDERFDYTAITARVHPEDQATRETAVRGAIETKGAYTFEYRVVLPDGTVRWISARGHCIKAGPSRTTRLIGVWIDVTAQKQAQEALRESEARFRAMADTTPLIVLMSVTGQTFY